MEKETLQKLVEELILLGEDKEELTLMLEISDILDDQAKEELFQNLKNERDALKNASL